MGQGEKHTSIATCAKRHEKQFGSEVVILQMRNRLPIKHSRFLRHSDAALGR